MISFRDCFNISWDLLKAKYLYRYNMVPYPRVIAYAVTWRCNAACEMCGIRNVDRDLKNKEKELTSQDIARIFKDPFLKRLDLIRFTGGEPFLKDDFTDIVEAIIKNTQTKIYYITTNGFYSERIFDFIERLMPLNQKLVIQVSLDAIGKAHDDIRKLPGLYDKAIGTLKGLQELKNRYNFSFGINQTVTVDSIKYLDQIASLSKKFDCDHKVYIAQEAHESDILEGQRLNSRLALISNPDKAAIKVLYEQIENYYKQRRGEKSDLSSPEALSGIVQKYILLGGKNRLLENKLSPSPLCLALFFYLRLLPDGIIMPCTLKPKAVGDLREKTFSEIWKSKIIQKMRDEIRACPGCWVDCDITPSLAYSFTVAREFVKSLVSSSQVSKL